MPEKSRPRRRGLALALVVLASVVAFAAILAIWVDRQVLNTANWTAASSEMLERPVIRNRVAEYLTDRLYANVDVEGELRDALPKRIEGLAGPIAGALRDRVELRAREALANEDVQRLWENSNRAAHLALLRLLEGGGPVASTEGDSVVLDLKALTRRPSGARGSAGAPGRRCPTARRASRSCSPTS